MNCTDEQLRGAVLEEVLLCLLMCSGYSPLGSAGTDPLIRVGRAGLELRGRGAWHQIDAVADFRITPPFGHQIRLVVEGKFTNGKVGLPVVRNCAGVLKDISENWIVDREQIGLPGRKRVHYLSALFSVGGFTEPAQQYAYAQDVFLVPLAGSTFLAPAIHAIGRLTARIFPRRTSVGQVRGFIRQRLADLEFGPVGLVIEPAIADALNGVIRACERIRYGAIAMGV